MGSGETGIWGAVGLSSVWIAAFLVVSLLGSVRALPACIVTEGTFNPYSCHTVCESLSWSLLSVSAVPHPQPHVLGPRPPWSRRGGHTSFMYSFIHSFIHSLIHSFTHWLVASSLPSFTNRCSQSTSCVLGTVSGEGTDTKPCLQGNSTLGVAWGGDNR